MQHYVNFMALNHEKPLKLLNISGLTYIKNVTKWLILVTKYLVTNNFYCNFATNFKILLKWLLEITDYQ